MSRHLHDALQVLTANCDRVQQVLPSCQIDESALSLVCAALEKLLAEQELKETLWTLCFYRNSIRAALPIVNSEVSAVATVCNTLKFIVDNAT